MIPPRDALRRVDGVETWLRRSRRVRGATFFGLVVATIQLAIQVSRARAAGKLDFSWVVEHSVAVGSLAAVVLLATLFLAARRWIQESREPFRYTCSVAEFDLVPPVPDPSFEIGSYLRYDLTERMNDRITRLSFLDEEAVSDGAAGNQSHIHISGQLLVRQNPKGEWMVEATPRIRMGPRSAPERLGHPVKFKLGTVAPRSEAVERHALDGEGTSTRALVAHEYEKVLERIYFSISSELYKQIRLDVETKIRLLPTRRLRAIAYLHEAEDYVRSNTLDAYEEARELFIASLDLFDPRRRQAHRPLYLHPFKALGIGLSIAGHTLRQVASRSFPRFGRGEILAARTEIGFAISLVDRRVLAGLSGHRMNAIFPARPAVDRALARLGRTSPRTEGSSEARFAAYVTKALTAHYLGNVTEAEEALQQARGVDPGRAETDARFLFAVGLHEIRPRWALPYLRRAVEYDPRLEIAQFEFALKTEYAWRMRQDLEAGVAERIVVTEYEDVLKVNPGNIRAWANLGYVYWLLGSDRLDLAEEAYWRGREYKEMRKTTQVAELDHGLARLYAEKGDFNASYFHYLRAVSGRLSLGLDHGSQTSAQFYFFDFIGPAMLQRFDTFLQEVKRRAADPALLESQGVTERVRDSVVAFALNDCGEAYRDYHSRTGQKDTLKTARLYFAQAGECNPQAVMPRFNRYLLESHAITRGALNLSTVDAAANGITALEGAYERVTRLIQEVSNLERGWADAGCARMLASTRVVERVWREVLRLRADAAGDGVGGRRRMLTHSNHGHVLAPGHPMKEVEARLIALAKKAAGDIERDATAILGGDKSIAVGVAEPTVRRLAPHDWLWGNDGFNWNALSRKYDQDGRWEEEVDDLHVRALFSWAAAQMAPEKGDLRDHGWVERRRIEKLLMHIRNKFWPGDFLLLRLCGYIKDSNDEASDLKNLVRTWLIEDPAARWALETAWTERWREEDLFTPDEKKAFFDQAKAAPDCLDPVREWIAQRENELTDIVVKQRRPREGDIDVRDEHKSPPPDDEL